MKDNIDIYWGGYMSLKHSELAIIKPVPLFKEIYNNISKKDLDKESLKNYQLYFKCPAAKKEHENIFAVKAPREFSFEWDPKLKKYSSKYITNPQILKQFLFVRGGAMASLGYFNYFFSEENIEMSQLPAYYNENNFVNSVFLTSGKYNISKWFRHVDPSFIMKKNKIDIKRGDTLFYVKFHTNKKVNLKNFNVTKGILDFAKKTTDLKLFEKNLALEKMYKIFCSRSLNKRILKEIKNNLTDY